MILPILTTLRMRYSWRGRENVLFELGSIRFVSQVTGRVLGPFWEKPEVVVDAADVEAFPLLDSSARSPHFRYKYVVNASGSRGLPADTVLLLRVYTVDVDTGELVVIGNVALQAFVERDGEVEECRATPLKW